MLRDRLERGIELYDLGAAPKLLMSGDHGRVGYNEVGVMKQYAIDQGVPSEDIFMDHAGFSTYETMYRAKEIFKASKVIVVTQEYHLYRALYIAEQLGIEAYGVSSDLDTYVGQTKRDIREILARCKDFAMCIFKIEPTYLGEVIPVNGNGDVTND
jgi:vancomycin permeability regulator SanA